MSLLDLDDSYRARPEDQIAPGDHDAIILNNAAYQASLAACRGFVHSLLVSISKSPNFKGDINGVFEWHEDGWGI